MKLIAQSIINAIIGINLLNRNPASKLIYPKLHINRRFLFFLLLALCTGTVLAQQPFSLNIKLDKAFEKEKFIINVLDKSGRKVLKRDSIIAKNGQLSYKGVMNEEATFVSISIKRNKSNLSNTIVVTAGDNNLSLLNTTLPEIGYAPLKISGNKASEVLNSLHTIRDDYSDKFSTKEGDIRILTRERLEELNKLQMDVLKRYPNDNFSALLLYELSLYSSRKPYQSHIKETFDHLADSVKTSKIGQLLGFNIQNFFQANKDIVIGSKVPQFSVGTANGDTFKNETLKGDTYMIVFSATWCVPCQNELPSLKNIYKKYSSKGLKVVYFNEDDDVDKWKRHIKENNLAAWINVSEKKIARDTMIGKRFGVYAVPAYFLIDKNASIRFSSTSTPENRLRNLDKAISDLYTK
ncbi:TlpA family protein disulfide reductase [Pedobacter ureilyticus]|uniref:TlpA family protein disulfide reductase n=1 Tax=Pedobacter ureilyticus TaxID=1393051 RepID=A0ABW9J4I0_9SPHI|nr:TlpA disulfide reductase family protein [Pedobacter helvus]